MYSRTLSFSGAGNSLKAQIADSGTERNETLTRRSEKSGSLVVKTGS